jgi:DtxR family Mn-dependent transcriptional regulator
MDHKPSKTVEDYLQVMHYMTRDGASIIGARLAERIGVAPPTVTATLQRMMKQGLITMDDHKAVHLTETGREEAESIVRRHALAERLLT